MKITHPKYTVEFDALGQIVSLVSGGKAFVGEALPLLQFRLRRGAETEIYTSNQADDIKIEGNGDEVIIEYRFDAIGLCLRGDISCGSRM